MESDIREVTYIRSKRKFRKLKRDEVIEEGAMQSWCNGELQPAEDLISETVGDTPSSFSDNRDFYNPI